jgi:hypothetical protein
MIPENSMSKLDILKHLRAQAQMEEVQAEARFEAAKAQLRAIDRMISEEEQDQS